MKGRRAAIDWLKSGTARVVGTLAVALIAGLILDQLHWLPEISDAAMSFLALDVTVAMWLALAIAAIVAGVVVWAFRLRAVLGRSATAPVFERAHNAIALPTGFIAVVKTASMVAAIQATEQMSSHGREIIEYAWWSQPRTPDGSPTTFLGDRVVHGTGAGPPIRVGDLNLGWSLGRRGLGWLYFGDEAQPPQYYELALSREADIARVEIPSLTFLAYVDAAEWSS